MAETSPMGRRIATQWWSGSRSAGGELGAGQVTGGATQKPAARASEERSIGVASAMRAETSPMGRRIATQWWSGSRSAGGELGSGQVTGGATQKPAARASEERSIGVASAI